MTAHKKNENTYKNNDGHETRLALLEQSINHINETLIRMEGSFNCRLDKLDLRLDRLDFRIDKIENRLWQILFLIASSIIGAGVAKIFHWF